MLTSSLFKRYCPGLTSTLMAGWLVLAAPPLSAGQDDAGLPTAPPAAPPGGTALFDAAALQPSELSPYLANGLAHELSVVSVDSLHPDVAFDTAIRVSIEASPANTWDAQISATGNQAVAKGDRILAGFWVRGHSNQPEDSQAKPVTPTAVAEFVFERRSEPHTKSVQFLAETREDGSWQHVWVAFESAEAYEPGEYGIGFQLGYMPQTIELGGLEVFNYGADSELVLPSTPQSYVGRDIDAQWRVDALAAIEQHRKADMRLRLLGSSGQPLAGTAVQIKQIRGAFEFGSAVSAEMIARQDVDGDHYREVVRQLCDIATIENGLKWSRWDGSTDEQRRQTLAAVDWLGEQNITVRGHVLVWPSFGNSPSWISQLQDHPEALQKVVDTHIREMGYATAGRVQHWDVLNEAFDNTDFQRIVGPNILSNVFKTAREVLPDVELYYNDYAGLAAAGLPTGHKDHFEATTRQLIDAGAPIDGIGIQSHFGTKLTPPVRLISELDRWAQFDKKILITEFDVSFTDPELQADFTRDFLISCFSHEAVDGIMSWGFWSGAHWRPESAFYDSDWNLTPMGKVWVDCTRRRWRTNVELTTDDDGYVQTRGFKGDYEIRTADGATKVVLDQDVNQTVTLGSQ